MQLFFEGKVMTKACFDSTDWLSKPDLVRQKPAATLRATRALYVAALLSVFIPLRSSSWASLAMGGHWLSAWGVMSLVMIFLAIWRIAFVVRDAKSLDAPMRPGLLSWCRALGIGLMALGVIAFVFQFFVGPIGRMLFSQRTESGAEFFVVGIWLAMFTAVTPISVLLFEASRLLSFERWYREQSP